MNSPTYALRLIFTHVFKWETTVHRYYNLIFDENESNNTNLNYEEILSHVCLFNWFSPDLKVLILMEINVDLIKNLLATQSLNYTWYFQIRKSDAIRIACRNQNANEIPSNDEASPNTVHSKIAGQRYIRRINYDCGWHTGHKLLWNPINVRTNWSGWIVYVVTHTPSRLYSKHKALC